MKKETIFLAVLLLIFAVPMILLGYYIATSNIVGIIVFSIIYLLCFFLFMLFVQSVNKRH